MILYRAILFSILTISLSISDSIEITVYSNTFTIDTVNPVVDLIEPGHGDVYEHGEFIEVSWIATDDNPGSLPVSINATTSLNSPYQEIETNIPNLGSFSLPAPDFINSMFVSIRLDFTDYYGNISSSYSEGYFTIGNPNEDQYNFEQETFSGEYVSETFTIDTAPPDVTWIYPNTSTAFQPSQPLVVRWESEDETLTPNPITIEFAIDAGNFTYTLEENITNSSVRFIELPDTTTQFGQFIIHSMDEYGNMGSDMSDAYMTIGTEVSEELQQTTVTDTAYSASFIVDTKLPEFVAISGENYFYPNGGETLTDYSNVPVEFAARDDSDENATVDVYLAYILGGWYIPIAENIPISSTTSLVDMTANGIVESSIWARLIFAVTDDYGNKNEQYNNDYFTLGSSEGDIALNWFNEDEGEILLDWGWNGRKHTVGMRRSSVAQHLQSGDQVTYVDLNGIPTSECEDGNGYVELYNFTLSDSTNRSKETLLKGINHCEQGGQKRPGYVDGNLVYLKITPANGDSSYLVLPDSTTVAGSHRFNDSHTVVRSIDFANPIPFNHSYNLNSIDNRDFDGFSIYNKITSIRDCDVPGTGENDGWCFEETVYDQSTYIGRIPNMQQSSNVKYRVWLLDNAGNEVFKTLDTEGINYYVELSDIYDKSLAFGWNWFSSNMSANDMGINTFLSSLGDAAIYIKSQSHYSDYYDGVGWLGTLTEFDNESMYKINLTGSSGNITYEGVALTPSETPLSISSGWNWISYIPTESIDINTALSSIGSDAVYIKSQSGYADYYDGVGWLGTISTLDPKDGYMLNASSETTLTYPDSRSLSRNMDVKEEMEPYWSFNYRDYQHNGSVTISIDDFAIDEGDQIAAFYKDECRGIGYARESTLNNVIVFQTMLYGDETNIDMNFKLYDLSENKEYDLEETILYHPNIRLNNILEPFQMSRLNTNILKLENPYPNPFNPVTTIAYNIPMDITPVKVNVYDITGRLVERLHDGIQSQGNHKIIWDASMYASGIYFVKLQTNSNTITKKLILIK